MKKNKEFTKRNKKKAIFALSAVALCAGMLFGCAKTGKDNAGNDTIIRGATQADYPPFCYLDENDNLTGFDVELMLEISDRLDGYTIEVNKSDWDSMFLSLDSNQIDLIADEVAITAEREKKYLFTEPYLEIRSSIVTQKGRTDIKTVDDLVGLKVVATLDSYGELLQQYNDEHPDAQLDITWLSSDVGTAEVLNQVSQGKYDAYVNDPVMMTQIIEENGLNLEIVGEPLVSDYAAIVLPKTEYGEELKEAIDKVILEMKEDGSLQELSKKWTGEDYVPQ